MMKPKKELDKIEEIEKIIETEKLIIKDMNIHIVLKVFKQ